MTIIDETRMHEFHQAPPPHVQSSHGNRGKNAGAPAPKVTRKRAPRADTVTGARERVTELRSRSGGRISNSLDGGMMNDGVEVIEYPDGSKAVRKKVKDVQIPVGFADQTIEISAQHQLDAEILAGLVGAQLGVNAPAATEDGDNTVLMEFAPGETAMEAGQDAVMKALQGTDEAMDHSELVALFDTIIDNQDRHRGNWLVGPNGEVNLIDHSFSFMYSGHPDNPPPSESDFSETIYNNSYFGKSEWHNIAFSKGDIKEVRRRLNALKPDFEARGRKNWHNLMMMRLKAIEPYATGTRRRI